MLSRESRIPLDIVWFSKRGIPLDCLSPDRSSRSAVSISMCFTVPRGWKQLGLQTVTPFLRLFLSGEMSAESQVQKEPGWLRPKNIKKKYTRRITVAKDKVTLGCGCGRLDWENSTFWVSDFKRPWKITRTLRKHFLGLKNHRDMSRVSLLNAYLLSSSVFKCSALKSPRSNPIFLFYSLWGWPIKESVNRLAKQIQVSGTSAKVKKNIKNSARPIAKPHLLCWRKGVF